MQPSGEFYYKLNGEITENQLLQLTQRELNDPHGRRILLANELARMLAKFSCWSFPHNESVFELEKVLNAAIEIWPNSEFRAYTTDADVDAFYDFYFSEPRLGRLEKEHFSSVLS